MNSTRIKQKTTLLQSKFESIPESVFEAPITRDELNYSLRSLLGGKSPGVDGIQSEFLIHLDLGPIRHLKPFLSFSILSRII